MPVINMNIKRAWWYRDEHDRIHRIHYIEIERSGRERHRYVDEGDPLYDLLKSRLDAMGYTGPRLRVGVTV